MILVYIYIYIDEYDKCSHRGRNKNKWFNQPSNKSVKSREKKNFLGVRNKHFSRLSKLYKLFSRNI